MLDLKIVIAEYNDSLKPYILPRYNKKNKFTVTLIKYFETIEADVVSFAYTSDIFVFLMSNQQLLIFNDCGDRSIEFSEKINTLKDPLIVNFEPELTQIFLYHGHILYCIDTFKDVYLFDTSNKSSKFSKLEGISDVDDIQFTDSTPIFLSNQQLIAYELPTKTKIIASNVKKHITMNFHKGLFFVLYFDGNVRIMYDDGSIYCWSQNDTIDIFQGFSIWKAYLYISEGYLRTYKKFKPDCIADDVINAIAGDEYILFVDHNNNLCVLPDKGTKQIVQDHNGKNLKLPKKFQSIQLKSAQS